MGEIIGGDGWSRVQITQVGENRGSIRVGPGEIKMCHIGSDRSRFFLTGDRAWEELLEWEVVDIDVLD